MIVNYFFYFFCYFFPYSTYVFYLSNVIIFYNNLVVSSNLWKTGPKKTGSNEPCYENSICSQELNLDNKCFQQAWRHHYKTVMILAADSEIWIIQRWTNFGLPHDNRAFPILVCSGKAAFAHSFYAWFQNRIRQKEFLVLTLCRWWREAFWQEQR